MKKKRIAIYATAIKVENNYPEVGNQNNDQIQPPWFAGNEFQLTNQLDCYGSTKVYSTIQSSNAYQSSVHYEQDMFNNYLLTTSAQHQATAKHSL